MIKARSILLGCLFLALASAFGLAQTDTVIYNFTSASSCVFKPVSGLTFHANNFYGSTPGDVSNGGSCDRGDVWEMSPTGTYTLLWQVPNTGATPLDRPLGQLVFDSTGNIYGITQGSALAGESCGTVFKLASGTPPLTETTVHTFAGGTSDGCTPIALAIDNLNNLFVLTNSGGTTGTGCGNGCGVLIEFVHSGGNFTETVLHDFTPTEGYNQNIAQSQIFLTYYQDEMNFPQLKVFGTSSEGGANSFGSVWVYESGILSDPGGLDVIHSFAGGTTDGCNPNGGMIIGQWATALTGTTAGCGAHGDGTVWTLSGFTPTETILYSFAGGTSDLSNPQGALVADQSGNFYGTTTAGGSSGFGGVFKLTPAGVESVLYPFAGGTTDGDFPAPWLSQNSNTSNVFGVTTLGGSGGTCDGSSCGVVFSVAE